MDYKLETERKQNLLTDNSIRSNSLPYDFFASKYDETDIYTPDDLFLGYGMDVIKDRLSPDDTLLTEPFTSKSAASSKLNLRMNGHSGVSDDPQHSEMFFGDMHNDSESDQRIVGKKCADNARYRTRYQSFKGDGIEREIGGVMTEVQLDKNKQKLYGNLKSQFNNIKESGDNIGRKNNTILPLTRKLLDSVQNDYDAGENKLTKNKKTAKIGNKSIEKYNMNDFIDTDFGQSTITKIGKSSKPKSKIGINEHVKNETIVGNNNQSKLYKTAAKYIKNIVQIQENMKNNDIVYGDNKNARIQITAQKRNTSEMLKQIVSDVSFGSNGVGQIKKSKNDIKNNNYGKIDNDLQFHKMNAALIYKNAKIENMANIRKNVKSDKRQFASEYFNNINKTAKKQNSSNMHKNIKNENDIFSDGKIAHVYKSSLNIADNSRMNIVHDTILNDEKFSNTKRTKTINIINGINKAVIDEDVEFEGTFRDLNVGPIGNKYVRHNVYNNDETVDEL